MAGIILPWQSRALPALRGQMPATAMRRHGKLSLEVVNRAGLVPHYHVHDNVTEITPARPVAGMQVVHELTAMAPMPCEMVGCEWFLFGRAGEDEGKPFAHPQGVNCGDFDRCTDSNCPCPARVLKWPDGRREGHVLPCRYCDANYRFATTTGIRAIGFGEAGDRWVEGVDTLRYILTRGL